MQEQLKLAQEVEAATWSACTAATHAWCEAKAARERIEAAIAEAERAEVPT